MFGRDSDRARTTAAYDVPPAWTFFASAPPHSTISIPKVARSRILELLTGISSLYGSFSRQPWPRAHPRRRRSFDCDVRTQDLGHQVVVRWADDHCAPTGRRGDPLKQRRAPG